MVLPKCSLGGVCFIFMLQFNFCNVLTIADESSVNKLLTLVNFFLYNTLKVCAFCTLLYGFARLKSSLYFKHSLIQNESQFCSGSIITVIITPSCLISVTVQSFTSNPHKVFITKGSLLSAKFYKFHFVGKCLPVGG